MSQSNNCVQLRIAAWASQGMKQDPTSFTRADLDLVYVILYMLFVLPAECTYVALVLCWLAGEGDVADISKPKRFAGRFMIHAIAASPVIVRLCLMSFQ